MVAPTSIPAPASALQLIFCGTENFGMGKLLGGGEREQTEPENFSSSSYLHVVVVEGANFNTPRIPLGSSLGSGPNRSVDVITKHFAAFGGAPSPFLPLVLILFDAFLSSLVVVL